MLLVAQFISVSMRNRTTLRSDSSWVMLQTKIGGLRLLEFLALLKTWVRPSRRITKRRLILVDVIAPTNCLQYMTKTAGTIESFNFRQEYGGSVRQLAAQDYNICFKRPSVSQKNNLPLNYFYGLSS